MVMLSICFLLSFCGAFYCFILLAVAAAILLEVDLYCILLPFTQVVQQLSYCSICDIVSQTDHYMSVTSCDDFYVLSCSVAWKWLM